MERYKIGNMFVFINFKSSTEHTLTPFDCLLSTIKYLAKHSQTADFAMSELLNDYVNILARFLEHPIGTGCCKMTSTKILSYLGDLSQVPG